MCIVRLVFLYVGCVFLFIFILIIIIIIIITDEYDLGGTVALLLQDHLTLLIVSHVTTNQSTTA